MRTLNKICASILFVTALFAFALCTDVLAQDKGKQKDHKEKGKKKSEQVMEKEKGKKVKAKKMKQQGDEAQEMVTEEAAGKVKAHKKPKYKPKAMTDKDMAEWTDGNPPGWSRGKKTGWGGAGAPPGQVKKSGEQPVEVKERQRDGIIIYPPQSEDWSEKEQEGWRTKIEKARERVLERMRTRSGNTKEDEESAALSITNTAGSGVPIERVTEVVDRASERGLHGPDLEKITRAMAYGADKDTDYGELSRYMNDKIDNGESGDDIAVSVYQEIDNGTMVKKKPWWKRWFGR